MVGVMGVALSRTHQWKHEGLRGHDLHLQQAASASANLLWPSMRENLQQAMRI